MLSVILQQYMKSSGKKAEKNVDNFIKKILLNKMSFDVEIN